MVGRSASTNRGKRLMSQLESSETLAPAVAVAPPSRPEAGPASPPMVSMPEPLNYAPSGVSKTAVLALIPSAVAFNVVLADVVLAMHLPIYLDCVGIITTTLIAGLWPGLIVCAIAFAVQALTNWMILAFLGTAITMGIYANFMAKFGGFRTIPRAIVGGLGMGIVSALISTPVAYKVFGDVTTAGSTFVTKMYLQMGLSGFKAMLISSLTCDPPDKILQCIIAVLLIRAVPRDLLARFGGPYLERNFR